MDSSKQEALWVLRAQCGDREALERLLESVQPAVQRYLRRLIGAAEADDVLQEVFVLVFRGLRWLSRPELFRPWLFRIASRAGLRHLRKRNRRMTYEIAGLEMDQREDVSAPEVRLRDVADLDAVSPASRAVLLLHFQEDLTLPEVAAILGIPVGTAKSRLAYGLSVLRKQLDPTRN